MYDLVCCFQSCFRCSPTAVASLRKNQLGKRYLTHTSLALNFPGSNYLNLKNEKCSQWLVISRNSTVVACHRCDHLAALSDGSHGMGAWNEMRCVVHYIPGGYLSCCDHVVEDVASH